MMKLQLLFCEGKHNVHDAPSWESTAGDGPSPEVLKQALKAFKKRLKLTRLDAESKVGHGPMSGGAQWGITAIAPPNQFPAGVWEELVRQGKLKHAGHGLYSLVAGQ